MKEPDWNRVREAVERVIAKHEQRIRNEELRRRRAGLRLMQKCACRAKAISAAANGPLFPNALTSYCWLMTVIPQIQSTPAKIFCTDKPEVNPRRQRALARLRQWGRQVELIEVRTVNQRDPTWVPGWLQEVL